MICFDGGYIMEYEYITTIGQDSHRFAEGENSSGTIKLGGYDVPYGRAYSANSDGDVILHAITNAISGLTGINILGGRADELCLGQGIRDSRVYLKEGLKDLAKIPGAQITYVSMSIECLAPKLKEHIPGIKSSVGEILGLSPSRVGITATTGEHLTGMGNGDGIQVFAAVTFKLPAS